MRLSEEEYQALVRKRTKPVKVEKKGLYVEEIVLAFYKEHGLTPETEHRFHPQRKWRFDFAFPKEKVALEVEGGVWNGGRHTRGSGFVKDMEKYNNAALLGWRVFRCVPQDVCTTDVVEMLKEAIDKDSRA